MSHSSHLVVDKEFEKYARSLDITIPIVTFEDISQLQDDDGTFEFDAISEEERERELDLPAFCLHTSGSTGHPKIITHVRLGMLTVGYPLINSPLDA